MYTFPEPEFYGFPLRHAFSGNVLCVLSDRPVFRLFFYVKADRLEEKDSTEVLSVFGTDKKEVQQQKWRDLLKSTIIKTSGDMTVVLIGIENQSEIHYAMPVKTLIYDALNYGSQVKEASKRHRKNNDEMDSGEFLSGFKKTDKLTKCG